MTSNDRKLGPTKFYQEDIVQRVISPNAYGVVLRCWHDAEDLPPAVPHTDPFLRPLRQGEVGVSFFPSGLREILPESSLNLVDRTLQLGDYCKRSIDNVRSGVVIGIDVKARLAHAISLRELDEWRSAKELEHAFDFDVGDYVLYDDWVGQIIELYDEAIVESSTGALVRFPELSSRLTVGDKGNDILPPALGIQSIIGFALGGHFASNIDTVLDVKHIVLAICWLAVNQSLDVAEAQNRQRPPRFWHGEDLSKLTITRPARDDVRVGDKVMIKAADPDDKDLPITMHGLPTDPIGVITVHTLVVKETRTTVDILWQDGTQETLPSTDLIPYLNPDEYDCWPGDHVLWKSEDQSRSAVVQSVNAADRVATIRFSDTGATDIVSVLELDPNGMSDWAAVTPHPHMHGLGVRRGDSVFIHREGTTNGLESPRVPSIGETEGWVREPPLQPDGQLAGWRKEMTEIGARIVSQRNLKMAVPEGKVKKTFTDDDSLSWFGEVTGLRLDGLAEVTLPNSRTAVYPLQRLTKLYDSVDQFEDDEMSEGADYMDDESDPSGFFWYEDNGGVLQFSNGGNEDDGWEDVEDDHASMMSIEQPLAWAESEATPQPQARREVEPSWPEKAPDVVSADSVTPTLDSSATPTGVRPSSPDVPKDMRADQDEGSAPEMEASQPTPWRRFDVFPSAPQDHAFYGNAPAQTSRSFLVRLAKEYRALTNSLPDTIIVRAYEDRTDLLRSLIIGPENTPYEDAPFVIDWMLDSNYPQTPPIAHFWSWTNGNGRVNPNLYEEGKVCLSILGTWAGDRNETWSAARSSLLQALVSIQGLVLVKEPWFCEPAYEKLRGTEEGIVNSRLYSEKAYVLSRGFVRRALEISLGSLDSDIKWFYYTDGRLKKVVNDARALIQSSKSSESQEVNQDLAVPRLTAGGIITLERTMNKLQSFLDSHSST